MNNSPLYIIDSNVFITAKNLYYAFKICPGFWDSLIHHHQTGGVCSLDKVRSELLAGSKTEDLVMWVKNELPADFFFATDDEEVLMAYRNIMLWAEGNTRYYDHAKAKFATEADGWLVAYAMVHDAVVVTNEQPHPESKNRILLPDVCKQFKIPFKDPFLMLKELAIRFNWEGST